MADGSANGRQTWTEKQKKNATRNVLLITVGRFWQIEAKRWRNEQKAKKKSKEKVKVKKNRRKIKAEEMNGCRPTNDNQVAAAANQQTDGYANEPTYTHTHTHTHTQKPKTIEKEKKKIQRQGRKSKVEESSTTTPQG